MLRRWLVRFPSASLLAASVASCAGTVPLDEDVPPSSSTGSGAAGGGQGSYGGAGGAGGAPSTGGQGGCGDSFQKDCDGTCVLVIDPAYGCGATTCAPCQAGPQASAECLGQTCVLKECEDGFADCDGDLDTGCEIDVTTDPKSCGWCGHDCLGATCDDALCTPTILVPGDSAKVMAADATHLYYAEWGVLTLEIKKVAKDGTGVTVIATDSLSEQDYIQTLLVDDTSVYWLTFEHISKADKVGGPITVLAPPGPSLSFKREMVADATNLYWTESYSAVAPAGVRSVPKAGGAFVEVTGDVNDPRRMGAGEGTLFFVDFDDWNFLAYVHSVPSRGGAVTIIGDVASQPTNLLSDGSHVYWGESGGSGGTVVMVPVGGGPRTELYADTILAETMLMDATHLYWTGPMLRKAPKDGSGVPLGIAFTARNLAPFTVDDTFLYFWGPDGISRVPK
jgi:hypothetical protein